MKISKKAAGLTATALTVAMLAAACGTDNGNGGAAVDPPPAPGPRQSRWSCGQDQADGPRGVASVVSQGCGDVGVSRAA